MHIAFTGYWISISDHLERGKSVKNIRHRYGNEVLTQFRVSSDGRAGAIFNFNILLMYASVKLDSNKNMSL